MENHGEEGQANWMLTRVGISAVLIMGLMVFSLCLYANDVYGSDPSWGLQLSAAMTSFLRYISLLFSLPVFLMLGWPILDNAMKQWRVGSAWIDILVVVGVGAAFIYSYVATLRESGGVYFETGCVILLLVTVGRYLEARGKASASSAINALEQLLPRSITVVRDGESLAVPLSELRHDDRMLIPAGERIAADGLIEVGEAHIDNRALTGESRPISVSPGDQVSAGALNLDGALTVRATAVGSASALGRLAGLVEQARRTRSRYEHLAGRVAAVFIPATMVLAVVAFVLGLRRGGLDEGIMSALALMLIACPCALGIATPMAIWVALGQAASRGILFRTSDSVERLSEVRTICLDKTGTLTTPELTATEVHLSPLSGLSERDVLAIAAGLARCSTHGLSRALTRLAEDRGISAAAVKDVRTVAGRGVVGASDWGDVVLGSRRLVEASGAREADAIARLAEQAEADAHPVTRLAVDGTVVAVFVFHETLRAEARPAVSSLRALMTEVVILTGDHEASAQRVADQLQVRSLARMTPEQKLERVRGAGLPRRVAMVGDGINDAPALMAADVGIAMGCGADVARESAEVCLLGDNLLTLPWAVNLARRTVRTIKVNLFWAFVYNLIGMALALAGKLNPVIAALAMAFSSLFVVTNSLRLQRPHGEKS